MNKIRRTFEYVDIEEFGTVDVELSRNHLNFHCILRPRKNLQEEVQYINTSHVRQFIEKKYPQYELKSCEKTDTVHNWYCNKMDAEQATGHWTFTVKTEDKNEFTEEKETRRDSKSNSRTSKETGRTRSSGGSRPTTSRRTASDRKQTKTTPRKSGSDEKVSTTPDK